MAEVFPRASRTKTRLKIALALAWCPPKRITAADKCKPGLVPRQMVTKDCRDRRVAERRWGEPRRTAEKALAAVIQEGYVHGVSTGSVDELVKAMGMSGISKSQVSRLCAEIDERVGAFLDRPLEGDPDVHHVERRTRGVRGGREESSVRGGGLPWCYGPRAAPKHINLSQRLTCLARPCMHCRKT